MKIVVRSSDPNGPRTEIQYDVDPNSDEAREYAMSILKGTPCMRCGAPTTEVVVVSRVLRFRDSEIHGLCQIHFAIANEVGRRRRGRRRRLR